MNLKQAIQNASPTPIIAAGQTLKIRSFPLNRWLIKRNRYSRKTVKVLAGEGNSAPRQPDKLAEYIAASTVLHCTDGWTFFSHAIDSLLSGDSATCVFMAYYAQIRAVMSFMASEGIGIFKSKHFWFDNRGGCNSFNGGTHKVVCDLISEWAVFPSKGARLLSIINFENRSFAEWVSSAEISLGSPAVNRLAREWLVAWSIDLDVLSQDHDIRNEASYRPQRVYPYSQHNLLEENLSRLIQIWRASEPAGSNRFSLLDLHLLKNTLKSIYRNHTGKEARGKRYALFIQNAIGNLGLSLDGHLVDFLSSSETIPNHPILKEAKKKGEYEDGNIRALPVISRAYLLLRLASAATQDFLIKSSIEKDDLLFWWAELGNDMGLWVPGELPDQMTDLWDDVKDSVDAIEDWYYQNNGQISVLKARQDLPLDYWRVKQFNRAGLWAIGI